MDRERKRGEPEMDRTGESFTSAMTLNHEGVTELPQRYILPPSQRSDTKDLNFSTDLPVIDLSALNSPLRPQIISQIHFALKHLGFFQVINHGVPPDVMQNALDAAGEFFNLPMEEKMILKSDNVLDQILAVNCYPSCPEPDLALGMPPHSDYGSLTILLQSSPGLQLLNKDQKWIPVPENEKGALMVLVGDQIEVMSNGKYKSVVHRVTVNTEESRLSIASLHSLGLESKIRPAPQLVDKENPRLYDEFSVKEFLDFVSTNGITKGRFIDTVKKSYP